jgi:UTP--glucose-1-phosphate uridylyltransferase
MKQMVDVSQRHQCSVLGVQDVPRSHTGQYGIVSTTSLEPGVERVHGIVEKPSPDVAPSTLAVVGRYILTPRIFHHLAQIRPGAGGEIQLTDGIAALLKEEKLLAYRFNGIRYDCGSKLGYLKAQVAYALKREDLRDGFAEYLSTLK